MCVLNRGKSGVDSGLEERRTSGGRRTVVVADWPPRRGGGQPTPGMGGKGRDSIIARVRVGSFIGAECQQCARRLVRRGVERTRIYKVGGEEKKEEKEEGERDGRKRRSNVASPLQNGPEEAGDTVRRSVGRRRWAGCVLACWEPASELAQGCGSPVGAGEGATRPGWERAQQGLH